MGAAFGPLYSGFRESHAAHKLQEDRSGGRRTTTHVSASVSFPVAQIYRYDNDDDDDDGKDKLIIDFSKHTLIRLAEIFDQDDDYWSLQPPDASNPTY
uniref:Uncharacterized protein n=1 Tax=Oryza rufipogon TaxID=4529 RepID=A0A0E0R2W6_ORYRU